MFLGKVTAISIPSHGSAQQKHAVMDFAVEEAFKGAAVEKVQIATPTGTECDLHFTIGQRYFVYAYEDSQTKRLFTAVCTRTRDLTSAQEDLDYVRGRPLIALKSILFVRDRSSPRSRLAGSEIIVEGHGSTFAAVADSQGALKIELPRPGTYTVTLIAPSDLELINHYKSWSVFSVNGRKAVRFELTVEQGTCGFVDLSLMLTVR